MLIPSSFWLSQLWTCLDSVGDFKQLLIILLYQLLTSLTGLLLDWNGNARFRICAIFFHFREALRTKIDENFRGKMKNSKWKGVCYCIIQPDDKINVLIHQMITPNEKRNVIIQPDDNSDRNQENIVVQPDDNVYVIIQQDDNTKRLWHCYHPARW
jgi:hypothetical protein